MKKNGKKSKVENGSVRTSNGTSPKNSAHDGSKESVEKKRGKPSKKDREVVTTKVAAAPPKDKKSKKDKKEKAAEKVINFKRAKKDFQINTKNASWKEIKALTEELLQTIKSFIWDVSENDEEVDKLSEFLVVQILYNCISEKVIGNVPGLFDGLCEMADRYPVVFEIK